MADIAKENQLRTVVDQCSKILRQRDVLLSVMVEIKTLDEPEFSSRELRKRLEADLNNTYWTIDEEQPIPMIAKDILDSDTWVITVTFEKNTHATVEIDLRGDDTHV